MTESGIVGFLTDWRIILENMMYLSAVLLVSGWCWWRTGQTPGKWLLAMRVVDAKTGTPISATQSVRRMLGYGLAALPALLGFLWIGLHPKKYGWHDKFAGTAVVIDHRIYKRIVRSAFRRIHSLCRKLFHKIKEIMVRKAR
jgi:uncharacterized RDD family membrane protein YckC